MAKGKATKKPKLKNKVQRLVRKEPEKIEPELRIALHSPHDRLQGVYSNYAVVQHTKREFVFDFIWRVSNYNALVSRIITSPELARELLAALERNIERYEKNFGKIESQQKKKGKVK